MLADAKHAAARRGLSRCITSAAFETCEVGRW